MPVTDTPTALLPVRQRPPKVVPSTYAQSVEPANVCLHQLFEAQVVKTPDAIALTHQGRSFSYTQLNQRANQLAHNLIGRGVGPNQLVAISLHRSLDMVVAFLGVLKAGAAYVPIDPAYPEARRRYILSDADARIVLTQSALASEFAQVSQVLCLDTDWPQSQPITDPQVSVGLEDLTYVIYTSGSTGHPKGVMAQHVGVASYSLAMAAALGLHRCDRMLQFSTMSFDFIVSELYPTLISGGTVVLRSDEMATSIRAFLDFITAEAVTVIQFTTAFWHELVSGLVQLQTALPESLRILVFGGEKASLSACRQWFDYVGQTGHSPRLINAYGPTEATVITTLYDTQAEGYDAKTDLPIGRPIGAAETYVLDEQLVPVTTGEAGELYIGGPGVTRGYLNLPEKTAKAFINSPFRPGARLYKTGDRVRMTADGVIEFVGRVDFQVKIRGFRIELSEVETALDAYPAIQQQTVLAREDHPGDKRLVAYIVMHPGQALDRAALLKFLGQRLPTFMLPSAFVELPTLPTTPNGKIDRQALPLPQPQHRLTVPPRSALEQQLATVWQSVLGVASVGITDNFFELGGHSLLVIRLCTQLESLLNRTVSAADLLAAPTIEQLAQKLEQSAPIPLAATTLTTLNQGSDPTMTRPLFLVHDADGDVGLYIHLARRLNRTVYGIRPLSAPKVPNQHSRIPDMAAHCIRQIGAVQPHGPYLIGGLCAGGIIAAEVASQLEQTHETVELLALLDTPEVSAEKIDDYVATQRQGRFRVTWQQQKNSWQRLKLIEEKVRGLIGYEISSRWQHWVTYARAQAFRLYIDRGWRLPTALEGLPVRSLILFACEGYRPSSTIQSKTVLFRATKGDGSDRDTPYQCMYTDPQLGWSHRVQPPLAVYDVPGGHGTMLSDENVQAIVERLAPMLDRVA
ncbi:MAG: amino acid adenylation domain-containing protein [Cyanobacteria bacterium J06627_15]